EQGDLAVVLILCGERALLRPLQRAFHGALPAGVEAVALILAHLWLEGAVDSPVFRDLLRAVPETYGDTCEVGGTEGGGFGNLRTLDGHAQNVSLELHEQVIDDRAAIDAQSLKTDATVGCHGFEDLAGLVAHGLQRGAGDMAGGRAARQADDGATRIGVPVGRAEADEGGYEINATVIGNASG